jgi:hypothetical protein
MLLVLLGRFLDASFSGADPARRKPTAQRLCAEALGRWATEEEFEALAARWAPPTSVLEEGAHAG